MNIKSLSVAGLILNANRFYGFGWCGFDTYYAERGTLFLSIKTDKREVEVRDCHENTEVVFRLTKSDFSLFWKRLRHQ